MRKQLSIGDKVYFKPHRYSFDSYQPWTIVAIQNETVPHSYRIDSKNGYTKRWVKQNSPNLIQATGGAEQCQAFVAKLTAHNKTWDNIQVGEYYRRYLPRYHTQDGFVYYKIINKTGPEHPLSCDYYKVQFKAFTDARYKLVEDYIAIKTKDKKIWGRNMKGISKLEGMMKMGE